MVAAETQWPAPAKLNLFLHVTGRRPDGYHELQTLFSAHRPQRHCVDSRDRGMAASSVRRAPAGVDPDSDLTVRAAKALQAATGCRAGASIRIAKRIPMGGGLGGGSSDAATVLLALNHLWRCGLSIDELARLGLPLGADVPCFLFEVCRLGPREWGNSSCRWSCLSAGMWSSIRASPCPPVTCSRALI